MSRGLVELIKTAAMDAMRELQTSDIMFGTVIGVDPLIIKADSDDKLILTESFLVLAREVTDYQTRISFDNSKIKQKITLFDRAEKESETEPLPEGPHPGPVGGQCDVIGQADIPNWEIHRRRDDDDPPPEEEKTTDIVFEKKWYENTLQLKNESGEIPEKIQLPAYHEITVYNHLHLDERVILIRQQGGQWYFVMDRIGVTDDDS